MVREIQAVMSSALRLRVIVPHFYREGASDVKGGYGSGRRGNRLARSMSLARCLGSVLALNRASCDWILNHAERHLELTPVSEIAGLLSLQVELHLFVTGQHWLQDVVELYLPRLHLHQLSLEDPRQLPLAAVRQLLDMPDSADLSLYLEDDIVISDQHFAGKLDWFNRETNHQFVLMPHRREFTANNAPQSLYVDGPIKHSGQSEPIWSDNENVIATGRFLGGAQVSFCKAINPHSGSFCVSAPQIAYLRNTQWPPSKFVGPLETAATGTVLDHFTVLKPSWSCRDFLVVEHGNPSFLGLLNELPRRAQL